MYVFIVYVQGSITTGKTGPPVINLPHNHVPDLHAVAMARCRSFSGEDVPPLPSAEFLGLDLGHSLHAAPIEHPIPPQLLQPEQIKEEYLGKINLDYFISHNW